MAMKNEGKNIAAFIQSLGGGGAQGVLVTVMNYYKSIGHTPFVVVETLNNDVNSEKLEEGIQVTSLNVHSTKAALKKTIEYITKKTIDYAFAFSPEIAVNLFLARSITRKDFVIIGRCINTLSVEYAYAKTFFRKYISKNLVKRFYKRIDKVVVQAENMGEDLIKNFGVSRYKICLINNPLSEKFEMVLNDFIPIQKENFILYVGRLERQKGLKMLIEAFSQIENNEVLLKLVGSGSLKNELTKYAEGLGISNRVEFVNFTSDIEKYYKKAQATILSSYYEGFPNVLLESIACGTPVASYDLPSGPSDIVVEGINGYLAEYLNVSDLTKTINKVLASRWDSKEIKLTANRFTRNIILEKYADILFLNEDNR